MFQHYLKELGWGESWFMLGFKPGNFQIWNRSVIHIQWDCVETHAATDIQEYYSRSVHHLTWALHHYWGMSPSDTPQCLLMVTTFTSLESIT
jgi:hypothetical protein